VPNSSDDSEQVSTTVSLSSSSILAGSTVSLGGITTSSSAKLTGVFSAVTEVGRVSGQYEAVTGPVPYAESIGQISENNDGDVDWSYVDGSSQLSFNHRSVNLRFGCRVVFRFEAPRLSANVTFYRSSISALPLGLLSTAAVIISLTGRDLDGIRGTQTRLSEKPIFHRRYRGPIVLKIAIKLMLDRRETMR